MTTRCPSSDTFTLTVPLSSPDMRAALSAVADAMSDAEFMCGASYNLLGVRGKRTKASGATPPEAGEQGALEICRTLMWRAMDMTRMVQRLYTDPAAAKRLRDMKRAHAESRRRTVTVENGRLVASKVTPDERSTS